jgi:hypothetical protein
MTGIAGCSASAANGHATAPPTIVPINSRRLMDCPWTDGSTLPHHCRALCITANRAIEDRCGSLADTVRSHRHVCFTPKSGHGDCRQARQLRANSRHQSTPSKSPSFPTATSPSQIIGTGRRRSQPTRPFCVLSLPHFIDGVHALGTLQKRARSSS